MEQLNVVELLEKLGSFERKVNLALNYAGLRLPQFKALSCIENSGKITVSDLSRSLRVTRATASVLVNQLIKSSSVEVIKNRSDKRSHYLRLSELGIQRLAIAKQEINLVMVKLSRKLPQEVIVTLNNITTMITDEF